jgi:hypothetical protein
MGIGIRVPRFGTQKPSGLTRPTSQEMLDKLKERNPGDFWRSQLFPGLVDANAGALTMFFQTDPIFQIATMAGGLRDSPFDVQGTYDIAHEATSMLSGADTYSDEWAATKTALKNDALLKSAGSRPKGFSGSGISRLSAMGPRSQFGTSTRRF